MRFSAPINQFDAAARREERRMFWAIGIGLGILAGLIALLVYWQATCLEWREIPGSYTCHTSGTYTTCSPAKECVRR